MEKNFMMAEAVYLSADVKNLYKPGERYDDVAECCWRMARAAERGGAASGKKSDCKAD